MVGALLSVTAGSEGGRDSPLESSTGGLGVFGEFQHFEATLFLVLFWGIL